MTVMSTNSANTLLYTGDSLGFMRVWFIANYCVKSPESEPPEGRSVFQYAITASKLSFCLLTALHLSTQFAVAQCHLCSAVSPFHHCMAV